MKKLVGFFIIIVALLGALGVLLDFFAKGYAENQIGAAITHNSKNIGYANASISSFPFTWNLVKDGRVEHLKVALTNLSGIDAAIDELDVQVDGLEMDSSALLGRDHVEIEHVDAVTVTAVLSTSRVRDAAGKLGIDLAFGAGTMTVAGEPLALAVDGTELVLERGAVPLVRVPIPVGDATVLPCVPSAGVTPKGVDLSCRADHLPKLLVDAIGSIDLKQQLAG